MKNLLLISNDIELKNKLEKLDIFNVKVDSEIGDIENVDILIVSDLIIEYNEFLHEFEKYKCINKIIYLTSNNVMLGNIKYVFKAKGIILIPPKLTCNQIINKILECESYTSSDNNIAVFMGTDSKVGTSITVQALGETLARITNKEILVLYLNGNSSDDYINVNNQTLFGIDDIKARLKNNILSSDEFKSICIKKENLYMLPGVKNITEKRFYYPEDIENLLDTACENFDAILIDAGCDLDLGMTIGALNSTKIKYLISTQQENSIRKFNSNIKPIFSYLDFDTKDFLLIINKFIDSSETYNLKDMAEIYETNVAGTIPFLQLGWQAERDRNTLLNYEDEDYNLAIEEIAKIIAVQFDININNVVLSKRKSWLKKIFAVS